MDETLMIDDVLIASREGEVELLKKARKIKELRRQREELQDEITRRQFQLMDLADEIEKLRMP